MEQIKISENIFVYMEKKISATLIYMQSIASTAELESGYC